MATEPIYMREKTLPERLRYLADKCIDIGVRLNEPFEIVADIGAVSFCLNMIADQLDPVTPSSLPAAVQKWVRQYDWAYSTTAECYGHEPSEGDVFNWCVFDADEDDPPLFEGATVDDAQMLVYVMKWLQGALISGTTWTCPTCKRVCYSEEELKAHALQHIDGSA